MVRNISNKPKTVLMVSHDGSLTGAPLYFERLARGLLSLDYCVVMFFAGGGPVLERAQLDGFEVYHSDKRPESRRFFKSLFYRCAHYLRFFKVLIVVNPDIVYSNTIVNCGEVLLSKVCGFRTIIHMHEGMAFVQGLKRRLALQAAFCDEILVGSEYAGRVLYSLTGKIGSVLQIGISENAICCSAPILNKSMLRVGILGTLHDNKGQMVLLEAISVLIANGLNLQLIIAGAEADSSYVVQLRRFVVDNGLEGNVLFLGQMDTVDNFFRSIDILTVCSYDEVFPTVILEAMREMKLVVATRVGGIPEIIDDGVNGFLYEAGDSRGLAKCIIEAVESIERFSNTIENANQKFVRCYGIDISVAAVSERFKLVGRR